MKENKYHFEEIDCAACASKIENKLNKLEGIIEARISFLNKTIIIKYEDHIEDIDNVILKVINKEEPDATISLISSNSSEDYSEHDHHHDDDDDDDCCCHDHDHDDDDDCCCHEHHHDHEDDDCCCHERHHDDDDDDEHECCCHDHHEHGHKHEHGKCGCGEHHEHEEHNHENDELVKELEKDKNIQTVVYEADIDCASCASKIEYNLNNNDNISYARVNFLKKEITVMYNGKKTNDIDTIVNDIVHKTEPDVILNKEKGTTKKKRKSPFLNVFFIIGLVLAIAATVLKFINYNNVTNIISIVLYVIAYIFIARKVLLKSYRNILKGNVFDENFLMVVASIGALCINEGFEAILVVLLYTIGEYFQDKALGDSTDSIAALASLKVDCVTLESGEVIPTEKAKINDVIIVKVGERIALDGIIIEGKTSLDMKALTGESIPVDAGEGKEVLSGSINTASVIKVRVTKTLENSAANQIIKLVEEASEKKSKTEEFITKFARIYTPIVLILALLVFFIEWLVIDKFTIYDALNNTFVFLVTSCPCALVISIPLAFFGGIGKCSTYGILVKGGNYIEALTKVKTICFDKTGTLTKGNFKVDEIKVVNESSYSLDDFINITASMEANSNHPIARAICNYKKYEKQSIIDVKEIAGHGLVGTLNDKQLLVGNEKLLKKYNIEFNDPYTPYSIVLVAYDNEFIGYITIKDEIKEDTSLLIDGLHEYDVKSIMLTGDKKAIAEDVAKTLKLDGYYAEMLPGDKTNVLGKVIEEKETGTLVAYVGDGINDTPSLKLADVGISIGGMGHDEAVAASDVVLLGNNMLSILDAIKVAKYTKKILVENIVFALIVKLITLVIGALGILGSYGMLLGVFADVGVCLIVILNTLRILRYRGNK